MSTTTLEDVARNPAQELYGKAAGVLAASRALAAAARTPGTATALGPTMACLESSLEALAEAAEQLGERALEDRAEAADRHARLAHGETAQRFSHVAAALVDAHAVCAMARTSGALGGRTEAAR